jgi:hypothetical protein
MTEVVRHFSQSLQANLEMVHQLGQGFLFQWHYAASWKVAGSIPDEVIGFFNSPKPSSRTMALGSTQPLTEISTLNLPGG